MSVKFIQSASNEHLLAISIHGGIPFDLENANLRDFMRWISNHEDIAGKPAILAKILYMMVLPNNEAICVACGAYGFQHELTA